MVSICQIFICWIQSTSSLRWNNKNILINLMINKLHDSDVRSGVQSLPSFWAAWKLLRKTAAFNNKHLLKMPRWFGWMESGSYAPELTRSRTSALELTAIIKGKSWNCEANLMNSWRQQALEKPSIQREYLYFQSLSAKKSAINSSRFGS